GLAVMTCTTMREAFSRVERYQHLLTTSGRWEVREARSVVRLLWNRSGKRSLGHRLANETVLAELVAGFRRLLGDVDPLLVHFRHTSPDDAEPHESFFRCPIRWSATFDAIDLPVEILARSPRTGNPALELYFRGVLEAEAGAIDAAPPDA